MHIIHAAQEPLHKAILALEKNNIEEHVNEILNLFNVIKDYKSINYQITDPTDIASSTQYALWKDFLDNNPEMFARIYSLWNQVEQDLDKQNNTDLYKAFTHGEFFQYEAYHQLVSAAVEILHVGRDNKINFMPLNEQNLIVLYNQLIARALDQKISYDLEEHQKTLKTFLSNVSNDDSLQAANKRNFEKIALTKNFSFSPNNKQYNQIIEKDPDLLKNQLSSESGNWFTRTLRRTTMGRRLFGYRHGDGIKTLDAAFTAKNEATRQKILEIASKNKSLLKKIIKGLEKNATIEQITRILTEADDEMSMQLLTSVTIQDRLKKQLSDFEKLCEKGELSLSETINQLKINSLLPDTKENKARRYTYSKYLRERLELANGKDKDRAMSELCQVIIEPIINGDKTRFYETISSNDTLLLELFKSATRKVGLLYNDDFLAILFKKASPDTLARLYNRPDMDVFKVKLLQNEHWPRLMKVKDPQLLEAIFRDELFINKVKENPCELPQQKPFEHEGDQYILGPENTKVKLPKAIVDAYSSREPEAKKDRQVKEEGEGQAIEAATKSTENAIGSPQNTKHA